MSRYDPPAILADPDGLDKMIEWKMGSISYARHIHRIMDVTEEQKMQRQFTIELRVDFEDSEKLGPMKKVLQQAARHAFATAQLISDNPKATQIAIWSDDFFSGHEEIKLLDDVIQQGLDDTDNVSGSEGVSSELMEAARNG